MPQHLYALMSADKVARALIPNCRLYISKLFNAALEFFKLRIALF